MEYQHLTRDNRTIIAHEIGRGETPAAIARMIGCHRSTIYREINRNALSRGHYESKAADNKATMRRNKASGQPRKLKGKLLKFVFGKMAMGWSPNVIAGRYGVISDRAIYDYLHREIRAPSHHRPHRYVVRRLESEPPFCHLPIGLGKYQERGKSAPPLAMAGALPISRRPAAANKRKDLGHYEADTAAVKGGTLLFVSCRSSRFAFARRLKAKRSDEVAPVLLRMLAGHSVKTITSDRGSEFARYRVVEAKSGGRWYVCDAHRPDQRGSIEGIIRQMRRHYPTTMAMADIHPSKLAADIRRLNNTPRKSLGYQTPAEVMAKMIKARAKLTTMPPQTTSPPIPI